MKRIGIISAAALFLLLGNSTPSYAQQEQQEPAKPPKDEPKVKPAEKPQETKPAERQQETKPAEKQQETKPEKQQEQPNRAKQEESSKQQAQPARDAKPQEQANPSRRQAPERTAEAQKQQSSRPALRLSVRTSTRIPDDRFRANFGQQHVFVISEPVMVGGFSRFQYGGFWFGFLDPWPSGWYYSDDVYVDFIDGGYYLCDPYYPGVRVSISVVV